jgi:MFS transporter, DHA2 family, methylenomycin A resistance protein
VSRVALRAVDVQSLNQARTARLFDPARNVPRPAGDSVGPMSGPHATKDPSTHYRANPHRGDVRWVIAAASFAFAVVQLDVTIVNVALPPIQAALQTTTAMLQWTVDGYALSFAVLLLSAGVLSDRIGGRRAYLLGFALFAVASAGCGLAPSVAWLIVARVVQGIGAALLVPSSLSLINAAAAGNSALRARAVGIWTAAGGVTIAAAPVLGGLLLRSFSWRSIFLVNLPLCLFGTWMTLRHAAPARRVGHARAFDPAGQVLAIVALSGLVAAIIEARNWKAEHVFVAVTGVLAVLAVVGFCRVEARVREPMLPLGFFRDAAFSACIAFGVLMNLSYYGMLFVLTLYLQSAHGYSALQAGVAYLPLTATFILSNLVSQPLTARLGVRLTMVGGAALTALGYALLVRLNAGSGYVDMLAAFATIPLGMGVAVPAMTTTILSSAEQQWSGTVSGALNAARQAGGATGVAIFGALVAGHSTQVVSGLHASAWLSAGLSVMAALLVAKWVKAK